MEQNPSQKLTLKYFLAAVDYLNKQDTAKAIQQLLCLLSFLSSNSEEFHAISSILYRLNGTYQVWLKQGLRPPANSPVLTQISPMRGGNKPLILANEDISAIISIGEIPTIITIEETGFDLKNCVNYIKQYAGMMKFHNIQHPVLCFLALIIGNFDIVGIYNDNLIMDDYVYLGMNSDYYGKYLTYLARKEKISVLEYTVCCEILEKVTGLGKTLFSAIQHSYISSMIECKKIINALYISCVADTLAITCSDCQINALEKLKLQDIKNAIYPYCAQQNTQTALKMINTQGKERAPTN